LQEHAQDAALAHVPRQETTAAVRAGPRAGSAGTVVLVGSRRCVGAEKRSRGSASGGEGPPTRTRTAGARKKSYTMNGGANRFRGPRPPAPSRDDRWVMCERRRLVLADSEDVLEDGRRGRSGRWRVEAPRRRWRLAAIAARGRRQPVNAEDTQPVHGILCIHRRAPFPPVLEKIPPVPDGNQQTFRKKPAGKDTAGEVVSNIARDGQNWPAADPAAPTKMLLKFACLRRKGGQSA